MMAMRILEFDRVVVHDTHNSLGQIYVVLWKTAGSFAVMSEIGMEFCLSSN